jgi:hypothetical protein
LGTVESRFSRRFLSCGGIRHDCGELLRPRNEAVKFVRKKKKNKLLSTNIKSVKFNIEKIYAHTFTPDGNNNIKKIQFEFEKNKRPRSLV